jgi:hypothetical protein
MSLKQKPGDLDALLHPARAYKHPREVVADDDLTLYEKRAVLSSWASDACAVQDFPALQDACAVAPVKFDDIMDTLHDLDRELGAGSTWAQSKMAGKDLDRTIPEIFPQCKAKLLITR